MKNFNPQYKHYIKSTINHYRSRPKAFWEGTKDHDVSQNYAALLDRLPKNQSLKILDFGCGPGRDLKHFKSLGHQPIGLDASPEFCQMARDYSGCEVWEQNFLEMDLPNDYFDGIFANASLFHVPKNDLTRILTELHDSLKTHGVLFSSNPRGHGERFDGSRFGYYMEFKEYKEFLTQIGFSILNHYYRPDNLPLEQRPWLAVVSQKIN